MTVALYGLKCNVRAPHRFMRHGAMCWVSLPNFGNGHDRVKVLGQSRGGRVVETWIDCRDLTNFRPGWVGDGFPDRHRRYPFGTRHDAEQCADVLNRWYGDGPVRPHAASYAASVLRARFVQGLESQCPRCGGAVSMTTSRDDRVFDAVSVTTFVFRCDACGYDGRAELDEVAS